MYEENRIIQRSACGMYIEQQIYYLLIYLSEFTSKQPYYVFHFPYYLVRKCVFEHAQNAHIHINPMHAQSLIQVFVLHLYIV